MARSSSRSLRSLLPLLPVVAAIACTEPVPTTWTEAGPVAAQLTCNPLAPEWDCFYPYPSDFFMRPDAASKTGLRVEIPDSALPQWFPAGADPAGVNPFLLHPSDGFSVLPQIGLRIPGGLAPADLIAMYGDLSRSLDKSNTTLIIDAETGELVPHFSEVDPRPEEVDDRALLLRPLVRLKDAHRYVVALHGLHGANGALVAAPSGFAKVLAGEADGDALERIQGYFEAKVFPVTQKAGVDKASLQLAWDFTTESDEATTGDMLEMRRQLLARYAQTPPEFAIQEVIEAPNTENAQWIGRELKGVMKVPRFVDSADAGAVLRRGPDGKPLVDGTLEVPFTVRVPNSVLSGAKSGRIVQYGHGFFGSHLEMKGGYQSRFADETGSVLIATDWMGMAELDQLKVIEYIVTDPNKLASFVDRTHQGMMNFITLSYLAKGALAELPQLRGGAGPLYDRDHVYYYGISQGSILGKTYIALSPHIDRAAFSVGGCSFGFMMSRASPFGPLLAILETTVRTKLNSTRMELLLQTPLDRIDPVAYAPHLLSNGYEGGPAERRAVFQIGLGDSQVPNFAEHIFARSVGLPLLAPGPREVFGLKDVAAPVDGSALVEWDFGLPVIDALAEPVSESTPTHEGVRKQPAAIRMIDRFLRPGGVIEDTCGGVCHAVEDGG